MTTRTIDPEDHINRYLDDLDRILREIRPTLARRLPRMAAVLDDARMQRSTIFAMGNGGSGAAASHLANDLNKYTITGDQPRFDCVALTDNMPVVLAIANDQDYSEIFIEQLKNHAEAGDVLIGISGSGESENCIKALEFANANELETITWTGFGGGQMADLADYPIVIPSDSMVRCEDTHVVIHHCLVSLLKKELEARSTSPQPAEIASEEGS